MNDLKKTMIRKDTLGNRSVAECPAKMGITRQGQFCYSDFEKAK